ncbi:MAG: glycine cleavage system aminomethyltransferase GcvT [Candidatus Omnitrophota bacterium]|jgi:aminomethyltransferase
MDSAEDRKTPLYEAHKGLGAKIVSFHGWLLPIQYTGILEEHNATRTKAGLFDVSHLGKLEVSGKAAKPFLQKIFTNNMDKAVPGKIAYSPLCNDLGGILDDAFIYGAGGDRYILIVNASTFEKDLAWMASHNSEGASIKNINDSLGGIAIQGPASEKIMMGLSNTEKGLAALKHRRFVETKVCGHYALLSRTGYTGEDGFEMFVPAGKSVEVWNAILSAGKPYGLVPAGLGSRDTLRLEAGCPLYGNDADETRTPLEAGFMWAVDMDKDFIGKKAIAERSARGAKEVLAAFEMLERAIPRTGYAVEKGGSAIGAVTSGSWSPTLKKNIGFAYVTPGNAAVGNAIDIVVHSERKKAVVVKAPFYRRIK